MNFEELHKRMNGIFCAPLGFLQPCVVLVLATVFLVFFGVLMVYSASSITSLISADTNYNAMAEVSSQFEYAILGLVVAAVLAFFDFRLWTKYLIVPIWIFTVCLLAMVVISSLGATAGGATRWLSFGSRSLQPSEFAKITVVFTAANIAVRFFEEQSISLKECLVRIVIGLGIPLALICGQPDKGTTMICGVTLLFMLYLAGAPHKLILSIAGIAFLGAVVLSLKDEYSRARVMAMIDPFRDPTKGGYQIIQGYYAISSGGIFGLGLGMSRQKYSYLPEAHNDLIFAVICEELGFVGAMVVLLAFALIAWAGLQIARNASDMSGRLVAAGCTCIIICQCFVNLCGVLGMIPLSGKPLPFISCGGSSLIASLLLVSMVVSVALHSQAPETALERDGEPWGANAGYASPRRMDDFALVGEATTRSARRAGDTSSFQVRSSFETNLGSPAARGSRVQPGRMGDTSVEGLRASRAFADAHSAGRLTTSASGRTRIDLGPSAADRLRSSRGR